MQRQRFWRSTIHPSCVIARLDLAIHFTFRPRKRCNQTEKHGLSANLKWTPRSSLGVTERQSSGTIKNADLEP
jgi:hypothetical protein